MYVAVKPYDLRSTLPADLALIGQWNILYGERVNLGAEEALLDAIAEAEKIGGLNLPRCHTMVTMRMYPKRLGMIPDEIKETVMTCNMPVGGPYTRPGRINALDDQVGTWIF